LPVKDGLFPDEEYDSAWEQSLIMCDKRSIMRDSGCRCIVGDVVFSVFEFKGEK